MTKKLFYIAVICAVAVTFALGPLTYSPPPANVDESSPSLCAVTVEFEDPDTVLKVVTPTDYYLNTDSRDNITVTAPPDSWVRLESWSSLGERSSVEWNRTIGDDCEYYTGRIL